MNWLRNLFDPSGRLAANAEALRAAELAYRRKQQLDYVLTQSEAFETWLFEECRARGLPMLKVLALIQANRIRLECELHWMNEGKASSRSPEAKMARHGANFKEGWPK